MRDICVVIESMCPVVKLLFKIKVLLACRQDPETRHEGLIASLFVVMDSRQENRLQVTMGNMHAS